MISDLTRWLFDPSGLTAHGFCLLWEPWLIWTHAVANIVTGLAYFSIPVALLTFARRRRDLVFKPVFGLFAAFILLCGAAHWLDLLTLWYPLYGLEGLIKAATAMVSFLTAVALWLLLPRALALPSPAQMRSTTEALREARRRERFASAPAAMHTLDADWRVLEVSDRWTELLGYRRPEVESRPITEFLTEVGRRALREYMPSFLAAGAINDVQTQMVKRSGEVADVLLSARAVCDAEGNFARFTAVVTDITARVRAEEALHQAQKMEAVGQLTGGIAHDFNNVLQAVTGNLELIRKRVRDDRPDVARLADNALGAAAKATGLTSQLLAFARRQRLHPQSLDTLEVVEGMRALLARTLGERITLRIEAEPDVGACLADRNQLEAALLNLAINARDALAGAAGTLTVSVRRERVVAAPEGWPADGEYMRIAVRDDGPGMPEEVRRRVFEPFFTTKPPGKGTGLGLAQIHGFAHQSGGTALVESAPGQGTEVAILLPRSGEAVRRCIEALAPTTEPEAGFGETVLVVEDDAIVRIAMAETLRDLRYRVVEATNADAALAMLDGRTAVDMVLSDVVMPGSMDGTELAALLGRRFPNLPVVLTTGRMDGLGGQSLPSGVRLLSKPLSRMGIAAALRRALAGVREPVGT